MEYAEITERFIAARFPAAAFAVIGGSTAAGTRTPTSDIDLLLLGADLFAGEQDSHAAVYEFENEIFEVFAYTPDGFDHWARRGIAQHRPTIVQILVDGIVLRGGAELDKLRSGWREVLGAGPNTDQAELATRRYLITNLLDDLRDTEDPLERQVIAASLFEKTGELMLITGHRWIGLGKYLPRRLREYDVERAERLSDPLLRGDLEAFADRVEAELERAGGRVQAGFVRR